MRPDDTFLRVLAGQEQANRTRRLEEVVNEHDALTPLKPFLEVPCEMCGEPMTEWPPRSVKLMAQGMGCAHEDCWRSDPGRMIEMARALKRVRSEWVTGHTEEADGDG